MSAGPAQRPHCTYASALPACLPACLGWLGCSGGLPDARRQGRTGGTGNGPGLRLKSPSHGKAAPSPQRLTELDKFFGGGHQAAKSQDLSQ